MDFAQQATYVIKRYNAYRNGEEVFLHDLIIDVCNLFDIAMDTQLKSSDYQFLRFIAAEIGVPASIFRFTFEEKGGARNDISFI